MDFRKVESGKLEIVKTRGNFLKFIDSLVTPFEVFAGERNIVLRRYYRMETPEILYDEEAMHKVITNLLSNAIKFTPNGGTVSLYISALTAADGQKKIYICVKDTGAGIPNFQSVLPITEPSKISGLRSGRYRYRTLSLQTDSTDARRRDKGSQ